MSQNDRLQSLNDQLGRVIKNTCNTIGCDGCPLTFESDMVGIGEKTNECQATHLQGQIMDIEYGSFKS